MKHGKDNLDASRTGLSVMRPVSVIILVAALCACGGKSSSSNMVPPNAPSAVGLIPPASPTSPTRPASGVSPVTPTEPAKTLKAQIEKLEKQGKLPKLDRSDSIVGPDVNANGVRDDIEAYIESLPLQANQQKAAMQDARSLQNTLTVDLTDKVALQKVGDGLMASTKCSGENFRDQRGAPDSYLSSRIEAMTANTRERSRRYMEYNAARSGSVTSYPTGDTCGK